MNNIRKKLFFPLITGVLLASLSAFGQQTLKTEPVPPKNWHTLDLKGDGYYGISLKQAYNFLTGKTSKTVVVATMDSGIDTAQADLKPILWVNPKEIPGNGIDDDNNGLVDDVHGWNFLGGKDGKTDNAETTEEVRQYYKLKGQYLSLVSAPPGKEKEFAFWQNVKTIYDTTLNHAQNDLKDLTTELNALMASNFYLKRELKLKSDQTFDKDDIDRVKSVNDTIQASKTIWEAVFSQINEKTNNAKVLKEITAYYTKDNNTINPDLDARARIVGDDADVNDGKPYGNNQIKNPHASHGTGVAGLIGAVRNNGYGIDGVADNVRIMALKMVPDGDEYDKDIANALHYAVDHGARIVNMSFGKKISPHKDWVDEAFKYAASKDVLLVLAAGNDGQDLDQKPEFPNPDYLDGSKTDNVIEVGASGPNKTLAADFSNYGKKSVDVFSPGVKVTSIDMDAEFDTEDGTSFSAPIVTGIAALIMEYYPNLSAKQVKEAILKSATPLQGTKVIKPGTKEELVDFTTLSKTGGIVNAYRALQAASAMKGERK